MIKFLKEQILKSAFYLCPGDIIEVTWTDEKQKTICLTEKQVDTHCTINKVGIFEFTEEFGMKKGFGGVFGEKYE